ncbi:MAG: PilZ domain-containing protein [Comamonadaceae bacterium]|nr:MAG: PilZ domain-containing protein [Comamonadaceae bacterium]
MAATGPTIPVVIGKPADRRGAERFGAAMPVRVDGRPGTTEDLSTSGLSFLADHEYAPGARIDVVIEYLLDGHNYPLRCEAEVVRVERAGTGYRVGARLMPHSRLQEISAGEQGGGDAGPRLRSV